MTMIFKTIRSQIAIYLCILLFSGMFLIALTALFSIQSVATTYASKNFAFVFDVLSGEVSKTLGRTDGSTYGKNLRWFYSARMNSGICRILVVDGLGGKYEMGECAGEIDNISRYANEAINSDEVESRIISSGVHIPFFSDSRRYVVISGPVRTASGGVLGGLVAVWDFDDHFRGLDRIERLLLVYVLINTFVLAAVGVYQIGNITAKPMKKILKKTESFCSEDSSFFNRSGSDFDQLSSSIGILVDDLSLNRKNLQAAIKELEDANFNLKRMQQEMIRAEKMASMGRLSAGLAHELGNPVGIIGGYLELLRQKDLDDSERMDFALRADAELKRIDFIIRELLDYARPSDHGKAIVSAHMIIDEVLSAFSGSRAIGSIALEKSLFAGLDSVYANGDQLRQVFMNIIINASDAIYSSDNRGKGKISVITDNNGGPGGLSQELVISFSDNGCGLPENDLENVFDPFFTTKPPGKGTGLGLSVSQMIIEDMGGRIKAFRGDACGTEIRLTLPIFQEGGVLNEK